jgi:hypothetical protein
VINTDQWYRATSALIVLLLTGAGIVLAQPTDPGAYRETLKERSAERETAEGGINDPFVGITTDGKVMPGLFSNHSTGVSTASIVAAAETFLNTLDPRQRDEASFAVDDIEWRKWANQANYYRDGLWFEQMSDEQRQAAFDLLGASLSARGLKLTQDSMKLNRTLGELNDNDFAKYGEWKYWLSIMGEPSATEPWGWQLDGHHLNINYVVLGDRVVMTPTFWGAEPTVATSGKFKGTEVLTEVTDGGLELINSLAPEQQKQAIINVHKDGVNILTQAFSDNVIVPYAGVKASGFTDQQRTLLRNVIELYVGNMRDEHARVRMAEVEEYLDQTWFAWIGETVDDAVFYYRIQSPVILIEFDHERPQGLTNLYTHRNAYREHIHAVVRTPNGNDYGTDLLKQHYAQHAHGDTGADGKPHWHAE